VRAAFPEIPIDEVYEVGIEFLHEDVKRYLGDKTAMDAIIRYYDSSTILVSKIGYIGEQFH
jgi:hypothetical protein